MSGLKYHINIRIIILLEIFLFTFYCLFIVLNYVIYSVQVSAFRFPSFLYLFIFLELLDWFNATEEKLENVVNLKNIAVNHIFPLNLPDT